MVSPVEAHSLSSLTSLFATPPIYPRNPTHEIRKPLVLYIVRTPGSRDVFLTPIKPPTKASISLEAINSCLYYLHAITADDEEIKLSLEEELRTKDAEHLTRASSIHRKPLPLSIATSYPAPQKPLLPPRPYPCHQACLKDDRNDDEATQLAQRDMPLRSRNRTGSSAGSVRRKPLGPRPKVIKQLDERIEVSKNPPTDSFEYRAMPDTDVPRNQSQELWPQVEDEVAPPLPSRKTLPIPTKKPNVQEADRIVLIRRDPSSGSQWNVGILTVASSGLSATVEIDTPGYQKFAKQDLETHLPPIDIAQTPPDETLAVSASLDSHHATGPRFLRTIDVFALSQPNLGRSTHQRNSSEEMHGLSEQKLIGSQSAPHGKCVFFSPWKGQCFFTTGIDGRSLICRHTLPNSVATDETSSETVCELRFNLPWVRTRRKNNQAQSDGENNSTMRFVPRGIEAKGLFQRIKSRTKSADQEQHMDLSLGQEKAGGGFRGSSAKLGKLVIASEGLKFADLAVGACMSIWWTHYSSSGGF